MFISDFFFSFKRFDEASLAGGTKRSRWSRKLAGGKRKRVGKYSITFLIISFN